MARAKSEKIKKTGRALRWNRRKAQRPAEIVSAALAIFTERGYSATRLDDVAKRAGVSKGTLYLYFDDKVALFRAVIQELILPELARGEKIVAQYPGPTAELLRDMVHLWWTVVGESRLCGICKLVTSEASNFPEIAKYFLDNVVARGRRLFARALRRGIARGEIKTLNVNYGARLLLAPLVFAAIWERSLRVHDSQPYDPRTFIDMHVDTFIAAHGAAPRSRRKAS
jgi:AcrR family transcriptional regulator